MIRLASDPAPCNVVWSRVIEVPTESESEAWAARVCGYHDLAEEWHWRRPHSQVAAALHGSKHLVQGRPCPRCKQVGGVRLDVQFDPEPGHSLGIMVICEPDAEPRS